MVASLAGPFGILLAAIGAIITPFANVYATEKGVATAR